ncbi:unnamed protein product [Brugia pahangi]|uniref:Sema domain-containing protein n=1 Tax=Brugia pahangi TaxID=6280 RepID=A0A0N4TZJ3_BRUPA|nr:unnamed protein product [Brugia pahangi]
MMTSLRLLVKLTWLGGDSRSRRRVLHGEVGPLHLWAVTDPCGSLELGLANSIIFAFGDRQLCRSPPQVANGFWCDPVRR